MAKKKRKKHKSWTSTSGPIGTTTGCYEWDDVKILSASVFPPEPPPPVASIPVFMSEDSATRKLMPVATGVLNYFPDALLLVAWISRVGNEKHNAGQPLHWAKEKSSDEPDAEARHLLDFFRKLPPDPGLEPLGDLGHLASKAWRALAHLQRACDAERDAYQGNRAGAGLP